MNPPMPALNTVRGFHTPALSGDEESDHGTRTPGGRHKIYDVVSANSSPMLRPTSNKGLGGISKLKLQLEKMNLENHNNLRSFNPASDYTKTIIDTPDTEFSDEEISTIQVFEKTKVSKKDNYRMIEGDPRNSLQPPQMIASDFETIRCLGKGTFGIVFLVKQQTTGRLYAQKQFKKSSISLHKRLIQQTRTERSILESVNRHPFVVKLFYAFQDDEKLYLILEYAQGGELFTHLAQLRMFPEPVAAFYMAEMVLALDHLHQQLGVVYRDLKPENCLLDSEGHLLLTDFGLSKVAASDDDKCTSMLGTVEYMAPEIILGKQYGKAVDWWSLGALGFDLLTGSPPFQGQSHAKIQERIVKQKVQMPYFLSAESKDLLTRLLRKEPSKRLGYNMPKDLHTIKKHRFFRKIDWKLLELRKLEPPIQPIITDPELAENFADEFTRLPFSPVTAGIMPGLKDPANRIKVPETKVDNPFGGFSYVASHSLLEGAYGGKFTRS